MDDQLGNVICGDFDLGPGLAATCLGVREIDQDDLGRSVITNNAVAQGNDAVSQNVRSAVNAGSRALLLTREATPQSYNKIGDVITYRYTVQNSSDVTVDGPFTVVDDQVGTSTACGTEPLAPGATTSCTASHTVTQADLNAGSITSKAFATGDGATSPPVTLTVSAQGVANQAPTAANDQATTKPGVAVTINVTANDSDPNGDSLTVAIVTQPSNGTATVSNNQIVYTSNVGFTGNDSFTYQVSDGKGGAATATVTVTVSENANTTQQIYLPLVNR